MGSWSLGKDFFCGPEEMGSWSFAKDSNRTAQNVSPTEGTKVKQTLNMEYAREIMKIDM